MKFCPICAANYEDNVEVCKEDGASLRKAGGDENSLIGKFIKNRYKVLSKLGAGGMGTVYLVEDGHLGRKRALKVLHGQYARDEEFVRRFRTEARIAASLEHRNVVAVYDFDQTDDGSLFIAMEYVAGQNLKDFMKQGPLAVETAVHLGTQIAEGLATAHRAGIVHRDIKPENIMVVGNGDQIKLMDFGIARLQDSGDTRLTRSGVIIGTPAYMSPEQAEGAEGSDPVTEKSDIYCFGIVLYEMLSGEVPFKASTPSGVLLKHITTIPVPLRKLRSEVPASIESVVMKALEKKPEDRQKSMDEVLQELMKPPELVIEEKKVEAIAEPRAEKGRVPDKPEVSAQNIRGASEDSEIINIREKQVPPPEAKAQGLNRKFIWSGVGAIALAAIGFGVFRFSGAPATKNEVKAPAAFSPVVAERKLPSSSPPDLQVASKPTPAPAKQEPTSPDDSKIKDHLKVAQFFRNKGEYDNSIAELEKARSLAPRNVQVQSALQEVKKACEGERDILKRTDLKC